MQLFLFALLRSSFYFCFIITIFKRKKNHVFHVLFTPRLNIHSFTALLVTVGGSAGNATPEKSTLGYKKTIVRREPAELECSREPGNIKRTAKGQQRAIKDCRDRLLTKSVQEDETS